MSFRLCTVPFFIKTLDYAPPEEPIASGRATLATQSHLFGTWVFVTNFTYNRMFTENPETNYILTLTHTLNPLWSVYLETQGISSNVYVDQIFRLGAAYLFTDDIQIEATLGANSKETPSLFFVNAGVSYRLDFHKDIDPAKKEEEKTVAKTRKRNEERGAEGRKTKQQKKPTGKKKLIENDKRQRNTHPRGVKHLC